MIVVTNGKWVGRKERWGWGDCACVCGGVRECGRLAVCVRVFGLCNSIRLMCVFEFYGTCLVCGCCLYFSYIYFLFDIF